MKGSYLNNPAREDEAYMGEPDADPLVIDMQSQPGELLGGHVHFCPWCNEYRPCSMRCSWFGEDRLNNGTPVCSAAECDACAAVRRPSETPGEIERWREDAREFVEDHPGSDKVGHRWLQRAVRLMEDVEQLLAVEEEAVALCRVVPPESFPRLRKALGKRNPPGRHARNPPDQGPDGQGETDG